MPDGRMKDQVANLANQVQALTQQAAQQEEELLQLQDTLRELLLAIRSDVDVSVKGNTAREHVPKMLMRARSAARNVVATHTRAPCAGAFHRKLCMIFC